MASKKAPPKAKAPRVTSVPKVTTVAKQSFKEGTLNRAARGKLAEKLKGEGKEKDSAFAIATSATKRMGRAGKKRAAKGDWRS